MTNTEFSHYTKFDLFYKNKFFEKLLYSADISKINKVRKKYVDK